MPDWHPVDNLLPTSWLFPEPGTTTAFAEIRYLHVQHEGQTVWRFRAVDVSVEPRHLVGAGYFDTLEDAAAACHRAALHRLVKPQLNKTAAKAWG